MTEDQNSDYIIRPLTVAMVRSCCATN